MPPAILFVVIAAALHITGQAEHRLNVCTARLLRFDDSTGAESFNPVPDYLLAAIPADPLGRSPASAWARTKRYFINPMRFSAARVISFVRRPDRIEFVRGAYVRATVANRGAVPPITLAASVADTDPPVVTARGDSAARVADSGASAARVRGPRQSPDPFGAATEAQLDSLYAPLVYVMVQDERGIYATLSTDGRRDFLRTFWARRDPTPGTPENEALNEFYERVGIANRDYREAGAGSIPGWRTDRGRVLILHGDPDEMLRQPQPPDALPYEVWKYTRGKPIKYVFVDLTRFGNYVLVWSNDLREVGRPNWRQLLGPRAVEEAMRF